MRLKELLMLDIEDKVEKIWKLELIDFVKMKRDYVEKVRRECMEKWKVREKELDELEAKAEELRAKGLCRVQFNPYVVKYRRRNGDNVNIKMDLVNHYPINLLKPVLEDFKNSILIEELDAMAEIIEVMDENARKEEQRKKKAYDDLHAKAQRMNSMEKG